MEVKWQSISPEAILCLYHQCGESGKEKEEGNGCKGWMRRIAGMSIIFVLVMQYNHSLMSPFAENTTV
jgi:hypothetical protein